jgi:hypothetical protein
VKSVDSTSLDAFLKQGSLIGKRTVQNELARFFSQLIHAEGGYTLSVRNIMWISTVRLGEIFFELSTRKNTTPFEEDKGAKISALQVR